MLSAPVPRNLRVRSSIQISSTRVPTRAFLIVAGLLFCGGLLIVSGAELLRTVKLTGALIIMGLLFELRCWGPLKQGSLLHPGAALPPAASATPRPNTTHAASSAKHRQHNPPAALAAVICKQTEETISFSVASHRVV